ncbi:MAG TPA: hypothetical protein VHO25_10810, partial [Polyangiaceae bacterium]|nr:hypothetical protein [Polyangiaceae bacterium]
MVELRQLGPLVVQFEPGILEQTPELGTFPTVGAPDAAVDVVVRGSRHSKLPSFPATHYVGKNSLSFSANACAVLFNRDFS